MEERMMKRTIAMLLVLVLALGMLPITAGAAGSGKHTLNIPKTYSVTFNETENNGSRNTADYFGAEDAIVNGEVGNPTAGDYYDWYVFNITTSHHLSMDAIGGAGGENTTVFGLYNSTGNLIMKATYLYEYDTDDWYNLEVDLDPGTYYIRVSDVTNWVGYQFATYLRPMLDAPTVSTSNRASDGKIQVSWNSVNYASSYQIVRSTSKNGTYTSLATVTGTSYTDTSAVAGTTYWYKVKAIHPNANRLDSRYSDPDDRTCDLPRPTNVKTTRSTSTGKVKISWNAVSGADKYELYCSTNGGSSWTKLTTITGTSVNHGSATVGTTYTYRVRAIDTGNSSANSAYSSTVTGTAVCAQPVISVSNVASTGKIKISWGKVTGASKYTLYIYDSNGNLLKSTTTTSTALNHTSAVAGKTYTYKVKAIGSVSGTNSALSASKSRTCDLAAPTLSISTTSNGKAKLSWGKVTGAVKYKVYTSTDGGNTWKLLTTVTGTGVTHNSALRGVSYRYKVMAVASNSSANSAYSNVKTFTVR